MDIKKWIEISNKEYEKEHPPDFTTHFNYVVCLNAVSNKLAAESKSNIKNKIKESKFIHKKLNLIKLIKKNLEEEAKIIEQNIAFAEVCVPWVAVKAYYLIFNLSLVLDFLISGQESSFRSSHEGLLEKFKGRISKGEIIFNNAIFNNNFQCSQIVDSKVKPGANLKILNVDLNERVMQILKKLIKYKLEDFQRKEKINNFRHKNNRQKRDIFLKNNTINLYEFFYWYRIKSNYRDLEFLDKDIKDTQFSDFYKNYFELTDKFYLVLKELINGTSKIRLNKEILQDYAT